MVTCFERLEISEGKEKFKKLTGSGARLGLTLIFILSVLAPLKAWSQDSLPPEKNQFLQSFTRIGLAPEQESASQAGATIEPEVRPRESGQPDMSRKPVPSLVPGNKQDRAEVIERQRSMDNEVRIARALSLQQVDREVSLEAVRFIQRGQYAKAKSVLTVFLDENPDGHLTRQTLATILMTRNEIAPAQLLLEKGLELTPDFSAFKKLLARILQHTDTTKAIALLKQRPPYLEDDAEYHGILAALLQSQGQFDEAQVLYGALTQIDQLNGRWWMGLGMALDALGEKQRALAAFQMALKFPTGETRARLYSQERVRKLRRLL